MTHRDCRLPLATCLALFAGALAQAQTADTPDGGSLTNRIHTPNWDGICAVGAALGAGCDTIRAREIVDAAGPPWRGIGRVNYASTRIRGHCTGTLVGERVVVTAAHCLYNRARKSWIPARSILFAAGYQRGGFEAMSRVERYVVDPALDTSGPDFKADAAQDWALLVLESPIGRDAGFINIGMVAEKALWTAQLAFAGYPALREHVLSVERDCGGAQYVAGGRVLLQQCAVMRGDSGGPVLTLDAEGEGEGAALVAVLSGVIQDGKTLVSASIPVAVFADALRQELGEAAVSAEIEAIAPGPVAGATPAPAKPSPPPAPIATYPPPPPVGR